MLKMCAVVLGVSVLACRLLAQGAQTPELQVPAIREPHHFVKLDNKLPPVSDTYFKAFAKVAAQEAAAIAEAEDGVPPPPPPP